MNCYEFWTLVGIWFTGLATLSAAVVALFVSLRGEKIKLKVITQFMNSIDDDEQIILIQVTNVRPRFANVVAINWSFIPKDGNRRGIFLSPALTQGIIPATLADGQSLDLIIKIEWANNIATELSKLIPRDELREVLGTLRVVVNTSNGQEFSGIPERAIIDYIFDKGATN